MTCPPNPRLLELAQGELAPQEARALEEHVSSCDRCRRSLRETERVLAGLRSAAAAEEREAYPADLMADIRSRLSGEPMGAETGWRRSLVRAPWIGLAAAAGLLAVVLTSIEWRQAPEPATPPSALSPFRTSVRPPGGVRPPPSLSPAPPRIGQAVTLGAGALSRVRPPVRWDQDKKEKRP